MTNIPKEYLDLSNDFGFTAVDEEEVAEPIVSDVKTATVEELKAKLLEVEKLVMPLLVNLLKDSETKEYIKWPNRKPVIEKQIERILSITRT
jgi:hypothetical protein